MDTDRHRQTQKGDTDVHIIRDLLDLEVKWCCLRGNVHLQRLESGSSKGITPTCRSFVPLGCRAETVMKPLDGSVSVCAFFFCLKKDTLFFQQKSFMFLCLQF